MINQTVNNFVVESIPDANLSTIVGIYNSGSDRQYYRFNSKDKSYILTVSDTISENKTFLKIAKSLMNLGVNIPKIIGVNNQVTAYIQEDLGDVNLLNILEEQAYSDLSLAYFKAVLKQLVGLQLKLKLENEDYYDFKNFGTEAVLQDLFYCKNYIIDVLGLDYKKEVLIREFLQISEEIKTLKPLGFMYRDLQSRNIMIHKSMPYFIDFQGGMKGPIVYDLISLTWQAKAQMPLEIKNELKEYYFNLVIEETKVSRGDLDKAYNYCLIVRLLQVLGAYGFRGLLQKKTHFIESLSLGIDNLKFILDEVPEIEKYPCLKDLIQEMLSDKVKGKVEQLVKK